MSPRGEPEDPDPPGIKTPLPGFEAHDTNRSTGIQLGYWKVIPQVRIGADPVLYHHGSYPPGRKPLGNLSPFVVCREIRIAPAGQDNHPCPVRFFRREKTVLGNFGVRKPPVASPGLGSDRRPFGPRSLSGPKVHPVATPG